MEFQYATYNPCSEIVPLVLICRDRNQNHTNILENTNVVFSNINSSHNMFWNYDLKIRTYDQ